MITPRSTSPVFIHTIIQSIRSVSNRVSWKLIRDDWVLLLESQLHRDLMRA